MPVSRLWAAVVFVEGYLVADVVVAHFIHTVRLYCRISKRAMRMDKCRPFTMTLQSGCEKSDTPL